MLALVLLAILATASSGSGRPVRAWLGIEYATIPARFAPAELSAFNNSAPPLGQFGAKCVQPGGRVGAERCLFLNIFLPSAAAAAATKSLPVMFWVHGGAMKSGSSTDYNGTALAARHNVLVVTINYRLGPLGYWGSAELQRGNGLMNGFHDQIVVLQWVRDNAAHFNADPAAVTIFGESAGGQSTCALTVSPAAAGLFHRAVVQS